MADTKITGLLSPQVTTNPATDVLPIVNIADTLMASSGSTRKITVNQILGSGGTATLASATISGDLTVDTNVLKVDTTLNRVGIGTASPATILDIQSAGGLFARIQNTTSTADAYLLVKNTTGEGFFGINAAGPYIYTAGALPIIFSTTGTERYRIASDGVATWSVGGSTAMTLNATGLGIGVVPSTYKLEVGNGSVDARALFKSNNAFSIGVQNGASGIGGWIGSTGNNILTFSGNDGTMKVTISDSGNVGIGVTPSYKFHALVASGYSGAFKASTAAITGVLIGNTVADLTVGVDASGNGRITADASKYLGLGSNGLNDRVILDSSGNVGIGVTPTTKLHVLMPDAATADIARFQQTNQCNLLIQGQQGGQNLGGSNGVLFSNAVGRIGFRTATTTGDAQVLIDASGNLLVGTTSTAGSSSNATALVLGGARTANGSVSATTAVATTIFSITAALTGRYEVVALIGFSGAPAQYTAIATIIWDGNGSRVVANNGSNLTITISGSNVQITQTSGSTQTVSWSFLRIAL